MGSGGGAGKSKVDRSAPRTSTRVAVGGTGRRCAHDRPPSHFGRRSPVWTWSGMAVTPFRRSALRESCEIRQDLFAGFRSNRLAQAGRSRIVVAPLPRGRDDVQAVKASRARRGSPAPVFDLGANQPTNLHQMATGWDRLRSSKPTVPRSGEGPGLLPGRCSRNVDRFVCPPVLPVRDNY